MNSSIGDNIYESFEVYYLNKLETYHPNINNNYLCSYNDYFDYLFEVDCDETNSNYSEKNIIKFVDTIENKSKTDYNVNKYNELFRYYLYLINYINEYSSLNESYSPIQELSYSDIRGKFIKIINILKNEIDDFKIKPKNYNFELITAHGSAKNEKFIIPKNVLFINIIPYNSLGVYYPYKKIEQSDIYIE